MVNLCSVHYLELSLSIDDFGWVGMDSTVFWIDRVLNVSAVFFTQLVPSSSYASRAELKVLVQGAFFYGSFVAAGSVVDGSAEDDFGMGVLANRTQSV